jgi:phosphoribosylanthranilate isomerase
VTAPRRTRVKFCGMTSVRDVALAVDAGADAVGVIVADSARRVPLEALEEIAAAIPPYVDRIGVIADQGEREAEAFRARGFTLQFSGEETPSDCRALARGAPYIKVFHVDPATGTVDVERCAEYAGALWMFDARVPGVRGGTGTSFDWSVVLPAARARRIVVSGGLTAENVAACIDAVHPYAVDVRSGIETDGTKDPAKMRAFVGSVLRASRGDD